MGASIVTMVAFSKFITGQRGAQLLLDTDGYLYTRRKERDTSTTSAWKCQKFRMKKCPATVNHNPTDESLTSGGKEHTHDPDKQVEKKAELKTSLKRKAAEQHLSATQNLLTEVLADSSPDLNVELPKLE